MGCTREKISIELHQGLQWTVVDKGKAGNLKTLVVIDNLSQDAFESRKFLNLVVVRRPRNIPLITLRHNIYQHAGNSKTINLNVTQMILFKNPQDTQQIGVLGRQPGNKEHRAAYRRATSTLFGLSLIDLDPQTDPKLKYCSD